MQAWRSYRPQGFIGSSTLIIRTDHDLSKRSADRWAKLIEGDTVIEIAPGVQEDMMTGQNASQIAQIIQKWAARLG